VSEETDWNRVEEVFGAIPLEESLAICGQIADGMEAAHEKGVDGYINLVTYN
jgi:hypothetical protein